VGCAGVRVNRVVAIRARLRWPHVGRLPIALIRIGLISIALIWIALIRIGLISIALIRIALIWIALVSIALIRIALIWIALISVALTLRWSLGEGIRCKQQAYSQ